jgi:hypothetical protein
MPSTWWIVNSFGLSSTIAKKYTTNHFTMTKLNAATETNKVNIAQAILPRRSSKTITDVLDKLQQDEK